MTDLLAWVDESESDRSVDPDVYVLGAVIVGSGAVDDTREAMSSLRMRRQKKVHWHDESAPRRQKIVTVLAELDVDCLVVVRHGRAGERSERRRRHALERLLYELDTIGVGRVVLESRGRADDSRDRALLDAVRRRRAILGALRMDHAAGPSDPMLWIPDTVCGAVTQHRTGDPSYLEALGHSVRMVQIDT